MEPPKDTVQTQVEHGDIVYPEKQTQTESVLEEVKLQQILDL